MLFIRATAVLVASIVIGSIAAFALPGLDRTVALWLLPALGLTLATLAVATWLHPIVAACVVGIGWVAFAAVVVGRERPIPRPVPRRRSAGIPRRDRRLHPGPVPNDTPSTKERLPSMSVPTVEITDVHKRFGRTTALAGLSFDAPAGITGLLGPNGAGKTTLAADGGHRARAGCRQIRLLGWDPSISDERLAIRRRSGYMPQEPGFHRSFTAFEFVDYIAILKEMTERSSRATRRFVAC